MLEVIAKTPTLSADVLYSSSILASTSLYYLIITHLVCLPGPACLVKERSKKKHQIIQYTIPNQVFVLLDLLVKEILTNTEIFKNLKICLEALFDVFKKDKNCV